MERVNSRQNAGLWDRRGRMVRGGSARARGFTLIETTVTIIIIAVLVTIAVTAIHKGAIFSRESAERQAVVSLKWAVTQFEKDFGFYPPVVQDNNRSNYPNFAAGGDSRIGPIDGLNGSEQPVTFLGSSSQQRIDRETAYLQGFASVNGNTLIDPDYRYSDYSLAYYLTGALDDYDNNGKPIDGAVGAKFTKPSQDTGAFSQRGQAYEATYDFSKNNRGARQSTDDRGQPLTQAARRPIIKDRWGTAIRYYRWLPRAGTGNNAQPTVLVPRSVGDPRTNPALASAAFAIVSLGSDKLTDDGRPIAVGDMTDPNPPVNSAVKDNIVEVGP